MALFKFALAVLALLAVVSGSRQRYSLEPSPHEQLLQAVQAGDVPSVEALIYNGVPVNNKEGTYSEALKVAANHGKLDVAVALLNAGAKICKENLVFAAGSGDVPTFVYLFTNASGLDASGLDASGLRDAVDRALSFAVFFDKFEMVKFIFEELPVTDEGKLDAVVCAAIEKNTRIIKYCFKKGVDKNEAIQYARGKSYTAASFLEGSL